MTRRCFTALTLSPLLANAFNPPAPLSWMLLNSSGNITNADWINPQQPVSLGSLLKPFLALAYLATHAQSPVIECRGPGCWHAQGHGRQDLVSALANSCNVYFLQLASSLDRAALDLVCLSYGLASPSRGCSPSHLIGLDAGWPQSRLTAAQAFAKLPRNAHDPHVQTVLTGMSKCAQSGTGRAINLPCFVKTGTAHCQHSQAGCGDGYAVAMYPLDQPRFVVLAMQHNKTGAATAAVLKPLLNKYARGEG